MVDIIEIVYVLIIRDIVNEIYGTSGPCLLVGVQTEVGRAGVCAAHSIVFYRGMRLGATASRTSSDLRLLGKGVIQ